MSNGPKRITELPSSNSTANSDLLVLVSNATGNAATVKMTVANFISTAHIKTTPANSTSLTVREGTILYDSTYLYVAVANNNVKRVLLESF